MNKRTLVLGASENPDRYSNKAIKKLVANSIDVVAIGLRKGVVAGVTIETESIPFENIHTVTLYLSAENQVQYYNYILSLKPKRVLFNPGTDNDELEDLLTENGIHFELACTLVLLSIQQY